MVVAALVLTGVGTFTLAAVNDRADTEADLREQVESLSDLFVELTIVPRADDTDLNVRQRLQAVAESISVEGIGLLILPRNGIDPIGELPEGLTIDDLDVPALQAGETVSNRDGDLIWAARASVNRTGVPQLLVLTAEPDPILLPAFRWFLVASIATIAVAGIVTTRLSRSLTDPIRAARDVTGRLADGVLEARIPEGTAKDDEVGELVDSINTMADNLERSKALERRFLMSVSHDLRTPLTSIKGYAEALSDGAVDDPARAGAVIEGEALRLERLVGDLLLLARLESTDFPLDRRTVDLNGLVEAAATGLQHEARERGVELTARVADTPMWGDVDPDRYSQVVGNLVGNALRFASAQVVVTLWQAEGRVHLAVGDDGVGIADDDLPHVFERLYVAKHNPAVKETGSGLGLAIVRDLTERMGGSVTARRSALGGAEFVVSFAPAPPPTP